MPVHQELKLVPYTPEQMFDLVIDIEHYPEFLPWCSAVRILEKSEDTMLADMVIRFKAFQEKYTSRVVFARPCVETPQGYIIAELVEGPFAHLKNVWRFEEQDGRGARIHFHIDFQFRSKILDKIMGLMFEMAQRKMVAAFEKRAKELYGK